MTPIVTGDTEETGSESNGCAYVVSYKHESNGRIIKLLIWFVGYQNTYVPVHDHADN